MVNHYIGIHDPSTGKTKLILARDLVVRGALKQEESNEEDEEQQTVSLIATSYGVLC
jgi:A49-like RNA polymerase I associated factor